MVGLTQALLASSSDRYQADYDHSIRDIGAMIISMHGESSTIMAAKSKTDAEQAHSIMVWKLTICKIWNNLWASWLSFTLINKCNGSE